MALSALNRAEESPAKKDARPSSLATREEIDAGRGATNDVGLSHCMNTFFGSKIICLSLTSSCLSTTSGPLILVLSPLKVIRNFDASARSRW